MAVNSAIHKRGGGSGCGVVVGLVLVLIIIGVVLYIFFNSPAGNALIRATRPPVQVSLTPYMILNGYYVNVQNTSTGTTLQNVVVTYTGAGGSQVTQTMAKLTPGTTCILDPSDKGWRVAKFESISVSADGYLSQTFETNALIGQ